MSRSGYTDDCDDNWGLICWRGAVASAKRGKRGQTFFKELLVALDAMSEKRLISGELEVHGEFCALGVLGNSRGVDMSVIDPDDPHQVSEKFNIAKALAQEVVFENDEAGSYFREETPEVRWSRIRQWVASEIIEEPDHGTVIQSLIDEARAVNGKAG